MTTTARRFKWFFWVTVALIVMQLALLLPWEDGGRLWVCMILVVLVSVQAAMFFRSWRILKRFEARQ